MTRAKAVTAHGQVMGTTNSRTNLVILRRRVQAASKRCDTAQTISRAAGAAAVIVGIFGVAGLFTGHAGEMEPLRLFVISLTGAFLACSLITSGLALLFGRALTLAEEALIRAGEMPDSDEVAF